MEQLEGGFINRVYLENGVVIKSFDNDTLVGISSAERVMNEARALSIFGGSIAHIPVLRRELNWLNLEIY